MHSDAATIFCPNPLCQAPNPESHRFCAQCRTPIPKRYLWATGKGIASLRRGDFLGGRYLLKWDQVVLDTQPGLAPEFLEEISSDIEPYLKLSGYQPQIPQVFGCIQTEQKRSPSPIVLLEQVPIYPEGIAAHQPLEGTLMPALSTIWAESSGLRQLNWLWQIAQLWQPLSLQEAASSLTQPGLLRVEGSLVRLLELQPDGRGSASLRDLGQLWQQWQPFAQADIADFVAHLCQQLLKGKIRNSEQLLMLLDRALKTCGQLQSRQIQIATRTDQGPSRQSNEDACYPANGTVLAVSNLSESGFTAAGTPSPVVVVCDGIGGHEGGEVASHLAIATVQQKLQRLALQSAAIDPATLILQLEQATLAANDVISQRNDTEQRQERQRMGTTLVMALAHNHEVYITHVGDSRAYRISRTGCHQVTQDDDLASREVRLGYALYREALQQPGSGSLVQALGMNASSLLHPTVQRFVLDEDCLFLLCSDGLSDHDRVEQHWQTELLPVLEGKVDLATASQRLVAIANTQNGHDNVTVGLVYCQMQNHPLLQPLDISLAEPSVVPDGFAGYEADGEPAVTTTPTLRTQLIRRRRSNPLVPILWAIVILVAGGLTAFFLPSLRDRFNPPTSLLPSPTQEPLPPVDSVDPEPSASPRPLRVGSLIQINRSQTDGTDSLPITLLPEPPRSKARQGMVSSGAVPAGSVLQIASSQIISGQGKWLKLKVCSVPKVGVLALTIEPGQTGWVEETAIAPLVTQELSLSNDQLGSCAATSPSQASK